MPMHGKKKKSKMMARGGYGTPTRKMKMRARMINVLIQKNIISNRINFDL